MDPPGANIHDIIVKTDYFQEYIEKLSMLLQPSIHCLNLIVKVLLHGPDGSGKRLLAKTVAQNLNMSFQEEHVTDLFDENIVGTEKKVRAAISKLSASAPCIIYLAGYELFCKLEEPDLNRIEQTIRECLDQIVSSSLAQPIIFIGSTDNFHSIYSSPLSNIFHYDVPIRPANLIQAEKIIDSIEKGAQLEFNLAGLLGTRCNKEYYIGNLINFVAKEEIKSRTKDPSEHIEKDDVSSARWTDIGGLSHVKREIIDAIQLSIDYPQLRKSGLRRTGILLYGPPGTGKTLLARAVATECSLNFINIKGPELLNEYVGQSEDNIRKIFQKARDSSPSVIFFDELDSLAPNRGQAGDSGGVMDRMVSQILAEMDCVAKSEGVFVIGATNRVDLVDQSLLRPGRFDKVLEVPLPASKESRLQILKALTRKMQLTEDVDLEIIESKARPNMSGADFQGLCSKALHRAFDRYIEKLENGETTECDVQIITSMEDFLFVLGEE